MADEDLAAIHERVTRLGATHPPFAVPILRAIDRLGGFVDIEWSGRALGVPLMQLHPVAARRPTAKTRETAEAIADWHYWVARGYELG